MFHGHTHVLVLSHVHGTHACLRNPRYYPPAFGDHFIQIAMDRFDAPVDCGREKNTLSPQDALLTDYELRAKYFLDIAAWGDLWVDAGAPVLNVNVSSKPVRWPCKLQGGHAENGSLLGWRQRSSSSC